MFGNQGVVFWQHHSELQHRRLREVLKDEMLIVRTMVDGKEGNKWCWEVCKSLQLLSAQHLLTLCLVPVLPLLSVLEQYLL